MVPIKSDLNKTNLHVPFDIEQLRCNRWEGEDINIPVFFSSFYSFLFVTAHLTMKEWMFIERTKAPVLLWWYRCWQGDWNRKVIGGNGKI